MVANNTKKIWTSGPRELLDHAFSHLTGGKAFDFRIAMISIDNAVELAIKTYLSLPKRIRGLEGPPRKRLEEASSSFPALLDLLEEYAGSKLSGIELGDIEVYHRLRNTLYHDGNGVTVDPEYVDSYLQIAKILLNNLLGIRVEAEDTSLPSSSLGDLVSKWAIVVQEVRKLHRVYVNKEISINEPVLHTVDRLITLGVLDRQFRDRVRRVNNVRNKLVHSASIPLEEEKTINVVKELNDLIAYLKALKPMLI
ncbi:hypothetical protein ACFLXX_05955 [Chloroflexota bacterium]